MTCDFGIKMYQIKKKKNWFSSFGPQFHTTCQARDGRVELVVIVWV